jgi:hypothetical protein
MATFLAGDPEGARPLLEESLNVKRVLGEKWGAGFALFHLGCVAIAQGAYATGRAHLSEGLALSANLGELLLRAYLLEALWAYCGS